MSAPRTSIGDLRRALRAALPADTFEPQPARGVMAWAEIVLMVGIAVFTAVAHLPWWANLGASLLLGQLIVSVSLAAHEAMHGSIFRSPRAWNAM